MNTKKGLSDVVTTLIIILLVIVAVGILWVVLRGMIIKGTNQISTTDFTTDLQIQKVIIDNASAISVQVSLNQGESGVDGVLVSISDGNNSVSSEQMTPISVGEEKTLTVLYNGTTKEVTISPIVIDDKGQAKIGQVSDTYTF